MKKEEILKSKGLRPVYYKEIQLDGFKADKDSRIVSGYLAAFGNIDSAGDVLIKGCFAKSLLERGPQATTARKIAFLWMHQMAEPIGHFTKLVEDDKGLYFEAYVDKIPLGDRVLEQYSSGTLNQHSIGYRYVWDKCKYDEITLPDGTTVEAFICYEINLFEGSVVSIACNENTPYEGMKGEQREEAEQALNNDTEQFIKSLSPETGYKARQLISRWVALAENEEPTKSLNDKSEPPKPLIDWQKITEVLHQNL